MSDNWPDPDKDDCPVWLPADPAVPHADKTPCRLDADHDGPHLPVDAERWRAALRKHYATVPPRFEDGSLALQVAMGVLPTGSAVREAAQRAAEACRRDAAATAARHTGRDQGHFPPATVHAAMRAIFATFQTPQGGFTTHATVHEDGSITWHMPLNRACRLAHEHCT